MNLQFGHQDKENINNLLNTQSQNRIFGKDISNTISNNFDFNLNPDPIQPIQEIKKGKGVRCQSMNIHPDQLQKILDKKPKKQTPINSYLVTQDIHKQFIQRLDQLNSILFEKDKTSLHNPQLVAIYADQITNYLKSKQDELKINPNYMSICQQDINQKMRVILIDWMIDVQVKFKLKDQTLFMFVHILDRYLQNNKCSRINLQLVGVAVMFLCCKYEEIYAPELKDFVYISDGSYTKQQILEMEAQILNQLEFNVNQITSLHFFERFRIFWDSKHEKQIYLAKYILELSLLHIKMHSYQVSIVAAATIYLVNKLFKIQDCWDHQIQQVTGYSEQQIRPCAKQLCIILQNVDTDLANYTALKRKYATQKFMQISNIKVERVN